MLDKLLAHLSGDFVVGRVHIEWEVEGRKFTMKIRDLHVTSMDVGWTTNFFFRRHHRLHLDYKSFVCVKQL